MNHAARRPGKFPGRLFALSALALAASVTLACGGGEPQLVFDSERDGDDDIYLMAPDGSDVRQLTNEPGRDYEPDASPDGKSIIFASQRASGDSAQLHLMNTDGSNVRRLTFSAEGAANRVLDDYAEWSRDGKRIAFQRTIIPEEGRPDADIWLIDPETGEERPLTETPDVWDSTPTFTADGTAVIFESNRSGSFELYRVPLDDGEAVRLTEREGNESEAKESPDGGLIAFVSDQDGDFDVYVMEIGGGNLRALTNAEGNDRCPQFSPDGKRIAFSSERDGNPEIYVMNVDGSDQRRLTETAEAEEVADWVP